MLSVRRKISDRDQMFLNYANFVAQRGLQLESQMFKD